ncbi:MAG TPA: hypothetical protein VG819_14810 [Rhizomicrobium sp.]|nr:hypothetical protein [Rhizomicrobium sp.]
MAQNIHYEIFSRQGAKGGWRMLDVRSERDAAIEYAKALMTEGKATGVKVVKETYNEDSGDFLTLKIFEDGHNQFKSRPEAEDVPHALPCFKPDDLYTYHARATISRLLSDYLARNRLTVTELAHRADALEKLEATGTILQHAIQKVAVAQASSTTLPVQQIVKNLNDLVNKAFQRVYRDHRKGYFPITEPEKFNALAANLRAQPDGPYILNGALAIHLRDASSWDQKVLRLLAVMEMAEGEGRTPLLNAIDSILAELLRGSAALQELIGRRNSFGEELGCLVELFLGSEMPVGPQKSGIAVLSRYFANDDLPEARTAIAQRLLAEFKSMKRLRPESLIEEFRTLRTIADRLVRGVGKYLSHDELLDVFTLRSRRLVTHETLNEHLAEAQSPEEKLRRLLFVEENVVGAENKRRLAGFVIPILTSPAFENHFRNPSTPVLSRLQALANIQARVLRSGFQDNQRSEIADLLDRTADDLERRAGLLESIAASSPSAVDLASRLLRLCTGNLLTEGRLSGRARGMVLEQLATPGFLSGYAAAAAPSGRRPDAEAAMLELIGTLAKAGISAETALNSVAA